MHLCKCANIYLYKYFILYMMIHDLYVTNCLPKRKKKFHLLQTITLKIRVDSLVRLNQTARVR